MDVSEGHESLVTATCMLALPHTLFSKCSMCIYVTVATRVRPKLVTNLFDRVRYNRVGLRLCRYRYMYLRSALLLHYSNTDTLVSYLCMYAEIVTLYLLLFRYTLYGRID